MVYDGFCSLLCSLLFSFAVGPRPLPAFSVSRQLLPASDVFSAQLRLPRLGFCSVFLCSAMPVNVGIIGTNWGAKTQVPIFRAAGLEVVALYSRRLEKAQGICEKADIAHVRRAPNPQEQEDAWRREVSDGNHNAKLPESVEERRREQERSRWGPAPRLVDSDGNERSMYEDQQQRAATRRAS